MEITVGKIVLKAAMALGKAAILVVFSSIASAALKGATTDTAEYAVQATKLLKNKLSKQQG